MSQVFRLLLSALRIFIAVYLGVVGFMFFLQEKMIFHPFYTAPETEYRFSSPFSQRTFSSDGAEIHSLLFEATKPKGLLLYFHGNAGNLEGWGSVAEEIVLKTQWSVWIVDYPGFGKSTGSISSEEQLHKMAKDFFDLAKKEFPSSKIMIYGRSVGSGLAVRLAAENPVDGLILESPFLNLLSMAKAIYPWAPTFLLKYKFMNNERLPSVKAPILIVHGDDDEIVPFAQGEELAKLNSAAKFASVPRGSHNNLSDFPAYWSALTDFVP